MVIVLIFALVIVIAVLGAMLYSANTKIITAQLELQAQIALSQQSSEQFQQGHTLAIRRLQDEHNQALARHTSHANQQAIQLRQEASNQKEVARKEKDWAAREVERMKEQITLRFGAIFNLD